MLMASTAALGARAEIVWSKPSQELSASSFDEDVRIGFAFKNTGTQPVRILSVDSGCSCTTVINADLTCAPGASNTLWLLYSPGGRVGRQERDVVVVTDDSPQKPHRLRWVVTIAEWVTLTPKVIFWKLGEAPTAKVMEIAVTAPEEIRLDTPTQQGGDFTLRLEPGPRTGVQRLLVQPKTTDVRQTTVIQIRAHYGERTQTLTAFGAIKG